MAQSHQFRTLFSFAKKSKTSFTQEMRESSGGVYLNENLPDQTFRHTLQLYDFLSKSLHVEKICDVLNREISRGEAGLGLSYACTPQKILK